MKNNPVTTALVGAAIIVAVLCAMLLLFYNLGFKQFQQSQAKVMDLQNKGLALQALAVDLTEYSKRHPDIDPLLLKYGMKLGVTNAPAVTAPAPKPPSK